MHHPIQRHVGIRAIVAVLAAVLLGGSGLAALSSATPSGAATRTVPSCTTSGLVEWINTQGNGAAGTVYYTLEFTNLSGHTCTIGGYPGVSGIGLAGQQIGAAARRSSVSTPLTLRLRNGATATATLGIVVTGNFSASACHPVTAAGLRVYAPNQTAPKTIPFPFSACASTSVSYLNVQAMRS
jgi:hypothetical protein